MDLPPPKPDAAAPATRRFSEALESMALGGHRSPLFRGVLFLIANQAVVSGLGFVFWLLAARLYPQGEVGRATAVIAVGTFAATLATLGLPYALVHRLPRSANPAALTRAILRSGALTGLVFGLVAGVVLPLAVPDLGFLLSDPWYLLLLVALVASFAIEAVLEQGLVAARCAHLTTAMLAIFALLRLPGPLLAPGGSSRDLLAAWSVAMLVAVGIAVLVFLPRALKRLEPAPAGDSPAVRPLLVYAAQNHAANLLALAAPALMPAVIFGVLGGAAGAHGAALFYVGFQIASLLYVVPTAISLVQFAEGARPSTDIVGAERRALRGAFALVVPGVAAAVLLADPLLGLFGESYASGGAALLRVLALAALAVTPATVLATRFRLLGRLRPVVLATGLGSLTELSGALILLRGGDVEMAGWSYLAGQSVAATVLAIWPRRPGVSAQSPAADTPVARGLAKEGSRRVAVMILNWNAGAHLERCVRSVRETVPAGTRVVVIDNASADGSLEAALRAVPDIEVQRNDQNLGFSGAYNKAIAAASEELIVLLNPDIIAQRAGWLEALVASADADPRLCAIACKLVFAHDPETVNSAGGMAYWFTGPVDIGFGERDGPAFGPALRPFAASGGAMLVRRQVFVELGGFDDLMFAYVEDVDLGWRMQLRGLGVGFASEVVFRHVFSSTLAPLSPRKVYLTHRNYLRAMLKNYQATTLVVALPAYALWTALKAAGALLVERSPTLAAATLRAVGWNAVVLEDTLAHRRVIQQTRVVGDVQIWRAMGPGSFEPMASVRRRRAIVRGHAPGAGP